MQQKRTFEESVLELLGLWQEQLRQWYGDPNNQELLQKMTAAFFQPILNANYPGAANFTENSQTTATQTHRPKAPARPSDVGDDDGRKLPAKPARPARRKPKSKSRSAKPVRRKPKAPQKKRRK